MRIFLLNILLLVTLQYCHAQWSEPILISDDVGLITPKAVMVGDTIHVVASGSPYCYYIRSIDRGSTWTEPEIPHPDIYAVAHMPDLAFSNNTLHLVYIAALTGQRQQVLHISSNDGGISWSNPCQLFTNTSSFLKYSRLACSGDTLFVTCTTGDAINVLISYNSGETWSQPIVVDDYHAVFTSPNIMYSQGRINMIYEFCVPDDTTGIEVYQRYSDDLGVTWSERYGLSTLENWHERKDSQAPNTHADLNGNIIALWMDYKYGSACAVSGDILGRVSQDNGTTWLPETRLSFTQTGYCTTCFIMNERLYAIWSDFEYFDCAEAKLVYTESWNWGYTWSNAEIITGIIERDELEPILFSESRDDNSLHCIMRGQLDAGSTYLYYLHNDNITSVALESEEHVPIGTSLTSYPNPFNSTTIISYSNPGGGDITIYDIAGRLVKTLRAESDIGGSVTWDAMDESGKPVCSGIYFVKLNASAGVKTAKLVYLK
jgi:hypothetical protein